MHYFNRSKIWVLLILLAGCNGPTAAPTFQATSPFLLRHTETGFTVYYQTTTAYDLGDPVPTVQFLSAFDQSAEILDNAVDERGQGYVGFQFSGIVPDCFAMYEHKQWVNDYPVEAPRELLPQPSDTWMCAEFDFEHYFDVEEG